MITVQYSHTLYLFPANSSKSTPDKKALKLVRLQDKGINVLTTAGNYIVTGDVLGHIKFFDNTLKLMNWLVLSSMLEVYLI